MLHIYQTCQRCQGTGVYGRTSKDSAGGTVGISPCPACNGTGKLLMYELDADEILDTLKWIKNKLAKQSTSTKATEA